MPLSPNSNNLVAKRPVVKKGEKSGQPVSKPTTSENKLKVTDKTEKLDLNINSKKSLSGGTKVPNIDVLDLPKTKDNRCLSSRFKISRFREIEELPLLKDAPPSERETLLLEKLRQCTVVFDWIDTTSDLRYKDIKKRALLEIGDYLISTMNPLSEKACNELICMIGSNIFRTLPPYCAPIGPEPDGDDDEPYYEPSWPHLEHVYEVTLRFLESSGFSAATVKPHIDHNFVLHLMELFDCEDRRERDILKTILHRIYGKMVNLRAFIRKQINNVFFRLIYETESFKGTAELLEILCSIINGFQVPLKEEHKIFLQKVLLPMHKVSSYSSYQMQLSFCIKEFIKKDPTLLKMIVVQGLIKFWPKTQSLKELMFLGELEEYIELGNPEEFRPIAKVVFTQLAKCVCSQQFQVCERALLFWNNDALQMLFVKHIDILLPATFPALYLAKQHWNKTIHGAVFNALKVMMEINQKLFDECTVKLKEEKFKELETNKRHQDWWNVVDSVARKHPLYNRFSSVDDVRPAIKCQDNGKISERQGSITDLSSENSRISDSASIDSKRSRKTDTPLKPGVAKTKKSLKN